MSSRRALEDWAREVGLRLDDSAWSRLDGLVELWQRYGRAFNLVGDLATAALHEHVREGLMAVRIAERAGSSSGTWLDVGSGGGVPGLVVAAVRPRVVLVEPRERRAAFLKLAAGTLNLREVTVVRARVAGPTWEKLSPAESFDPKSVEFRIASAKAVMPLEQWLSQARALAPTALTIAHTTVGAAETASVDAVCSLRWGDRVVLGVRTGDDIEEIGVER